MGKLYLVDDVGLWSEVINNTDNFTNKAAIFMDRDGTFIEDCGYLSDPKKVKLIESSCSFLKKCNDANIPVIVVTNQSGIARGYFTWDDFSNIEKVVREFLKRQNIFLDMVCACGYYKEGNEKYRIDKELWRKPHPGMINEAGKKLNINLSKSWIIGNNSSDIEAGRNAGLAGGIFLNKDKKEKQVFDNFIVYEKSKLVDMDWLIKKLSV